MNECKGYLFEFAVSLELSKIYQLEKVFLNSIPPVLYQKILQYQVDFSNHKYQELQIIIKLAQQSSELIAKRFPQADHLRLSGKIASEFDLLGQSEADLIIESQGSSHGISLKLTMHKGDIHTKSAGYKSILSKYFSSYFPQALEDQEELNRFLEREFSQMALDLNLDQGLDPRSDFSLWNELGLPTLPGELDIELKERVHYYYYQLKLKLEKILKTYKEFDSKLFDQALSPFLGQTDSRVLGLIVSYDLEGRADFQFIDTDLSSRIQKLEFPLSEAKNSYFDLKIYQQEKAEITLRMRIKPMNEFTVPGIKVNSSLILTNS